MTTENAVQQLPVTISTNFMQRLRKLGYKLSPFTPDDAGRGGRTQIRCNVEAAQYDECVAEIQKARRGSK